MPTHLRQSTFAGGEIAPTLYGRTDLAKYAHSLRRCRNFFVNQHGALLNRPGTTFVREVKDSTKKVRLVPFLFANGQNFVLEVGDHYIRFYQNGGIVVNGAAPYHDGVLDDPLPPANDPYEVVSPYAEAHLSDLKFAQSGDIITITHTGYAPRELRRYGNTNWRVVTIDFGYLTSGLLTHANPPISPRGYVQYDMSQTVSGSLKRVEYAITAIFKNDTSGRIYETLAWYFTSWATIRDPTVAAWSGVPTYSDGDLVTRNSNVYRANGSVPANTDPALQTWPGGYWTPLFVGTQVPQVGLNLSLAEHRPTIGWSALATPAGYTCLGYNLYRGQGRTFGLLISLDPTMTSYQDDGVLDPDFANVPPAGINPFTSDYPGASAFFEQRRMMARTLAKPSDFWGSKVGDFYNFDDKAIVVDDDAINFTLASLRYEEIRSLLPLRALIALTNEGVWLISGSGGANDALTATSVRARPQNYKGCSMLDPLVVGEAALACSQLGNVVQEMVFDFSTDSYRGSELSIFSTHLFETHSITSWCYQRTPYSLVWAVRDDGILLGLSYSREHEMVAWHWHDTDGAFESVCSIPEGTEDAVYVSVRRTIGGVTKRYVEKFASRILPRLPNGSTDTRKGVFLDSALIYNGSPATTFTGLGHLEGKTVHVLADGLTVGSYVVTSGQINISSQLPDGASYVIAGLQYLSELETVDLMLSGIDIRSNTKNIFRASFEVVEARSLWFGKDFDHLKEWVQRQVKDSYGAVAPFTGLEHVRFPASYEHEGRMVGRHDDPLPIAIVGIAREIDVGGD